MSNMWTNRKPKRTTWKMTVDNRTQAQQWLDMMRVIEASGFFSQIKYSITQQYTTRKNYRDPEGTDESRAGDDTGTAYWNLSATLEFSGQENKHVPESTPADNFEESTKY